MYVYIYGMVESNKRSLANYYSGETATFLQKQRNIHSIPFSIEHNLRCLVDVLDAGNSGFIKRQA